MQTTKMRNSEYEIVKINPKCKLLPAEQLIKLRGVEFIPVKSGLKKTVPDGFQEVQAELNKLRDELRKQLSIQRIERICVRNIGHWDAKENAVRIERKEGKFETFGYWKQSQLFLRYYEALFLLELNRLEIYNSELLSIDEAYFLLLDKEKLDKYIVYSTLSRSGYIVQRYNRSFDYVFNEDELIWETLCKCLNEDYNLPPSIEKSASYLSMRSSFNLTIDFIKSGKIIEVKDDEEQTIDSIKRPMRAASVKYEESPNQKQNRHSSNQNSKGSFLNFLKNEDEYQKFEKIFKSFDLIGLSGDEPKVSDLSSGLEIDFDLFLPNDGFKKSEASEPVMRVVIVPADKDFPTTTEVRKCFASQNVMVPLLLVTVGESKQIQAFLYYYS